MWSYQRELHIFCDASEKAYGSVAYLKIEGQDGQVHVSFVMARSQVAPSNTLSIPRLELSAALTGAQLAHLIQAELTLSLHQTIQWMDSTVVLNWLQSDSYRYKVFVVNIIVYVCKLKPKPSRWHNEGQYHSRTNHTRRMAQRPILYLLSKQPSIPQPASWLNIKMPTAYTYR